MLLSGSMIATGALIYDNMLNKKALFDTVALALFLQYRSIADLVPLFSGIHLRRPCHGIRCCSD